MRTAARWLSVLLHPLFMPVFTLWLAFRVDPHLAFFIPDEARWIILGMVALMTIVFPLTSALLLLRAGLISSLLMPTRTERIAPYIMTMIYYAMTWYLLRRSPLHPAVHGLFLGALVALGVTTVVTFRWKISAHMVGIGGAIGALVGLSVLHSLPLLPPIAALIVLAGALASARLLSSDHSPAQVYAGVLLGGACTYVCVVLFAAP
ncbi:MAG: hypothetical protein ABI432_01070 [Flavobacteriales bacterium]